MRGPFLTVTLAAALFVAPATHAQTSPDLWESQLDSALSADTPIEETATSLKALIETAPSQNDKLVANYFLGETSLELGRAGEAIYYTESALKINDEKFSDDIKQRDTIVNLLIKAYQKAGRSDDMFRLINENVARKDGLMTDIWSASPDGITHRMSGLYCPNALDGIFRDKALNFSPVGIDVGCNYKAITEHRNDITVYLTKTGTDAEKSHEDAIAAVIGNWGEDKIVYRAKPASFIAPQGLQVLDTLFYNENEIWTQAFTASIQGWTLKARITWDEALGKDFGKVQGAKLFVALADNVPARLAACNARIDTGKGVQANGPAAMSVLLFISADTDTSQTPARPTFECIVRASDTEEWFLASHSDAAVRRYTIDGNDVDSDVFVMNFPSELATASKGLFVLMDAPKRGTSGSKKVIAVYDGVPSEETVFQDFYRYRQAPGKIAGSVSTSDTGERTVNINPETLK